MVGVLPRVHGSALFTRGETQALCVATLGTGQDEQMIDALEGDRREHYMLHYNFPPYSVGETGRMGSPGRREVGHGKLAWRATRPLLPSKDAFPYTIRVVSEVTESNGSSSMATVCGTSLALMDAGVPLPRSVAGIAMGLIKEGDRFAVLSDILGDEDHLGDMDFKVAGTEDGVTSLQMDIKIAGITPEIMEVALHQARDGRMHILGEMAKALGMPRPEMRETVPRVTTIQIPTDKIGAVIGGGGKTIREITERTGTKIDIQDDGTIKIASTDAMASQRAVDWIRGLTASPEVGTIYEGKVARIVDFGAFVNMLGNIDGLCHISELSNERVGKVTDVVKEGDMVKVKVLAIDDRGKIKLSMRAVDQVTGESLEVAPRPPRPPREGEGERWRDRGGERRDGGFRRRRERRMSDRQPSRAAERRISAGGIGRVGSRSMSVVQPMLVSGLEVWPLVEGGKGVAVSSGRSAGAWAAAGGVGTFSGVNPDALDDNGEYIPLVFRGRDRLERHEELIAYSIQGGISQARIAHATRQGEGRIHMNVLWEMGSCERVLQGVLDGAKGLIHGVTCGAGMPYRLARDLRPLRGLLLPDRLLGARLQRALEARLPQVPGLAGCRGLRGPVARRRP